MVTTVFIDKKYFAEGGFKDGDKIVRPGCAGWVAYMQHRIYKQNKNCLILVSGATGSGKSWACLSLAELLLPKGKVFHIDNVVFRINDLIKRVRRGDLKRGDIIVVEEAGVAAAKLSWWTEQNKALSALLQTFRSLGFIIFFNLPSTCFFDSSSKRLIHFIFETQYIKNGECTMKNSIIQVNERLNKIYYKRLRVAVKESNRVWTVTGTAIPRPSKRLIDLYEAKKKAYQENLYKRLEGILDSAEAKEQRGMTPRIQYFCTKCAHIWLSRTKPTICPQKECRRSYVEKYTAKSRIVRDEE